MRISRKLCSKKTNKASDGVLNPSGVRVCFGQTITIATFQTNLVQFGTSELYNILALPEFSPITLDGLTVGQQRATGIYSDPAERVILFLKVSAEHSSNSTIPNQEVVDQLKERIAQDHSRRHVPSYFFEVPEIPHNANGKKMEIQVKQVCNEGAKVLEKMTLSDSERELLTAFVKFHDVEDIVKQHKRRSKL